MLARIDKEALSDLAPRLIDQSRQAPVHVITANPEVVMLAGSNAALGASFDDPETVIVADGVGIIWAQEQIGMEPSPLIPGIELAQDLLDRVAKKGGTVFLYGAREHVLNDFEKFIAQTYPGITVIGSHNGYDESIDAVIKDLAANQADLVLVALGAPKQDEFIRAALPRVSRGILVGVGGTFDTLSGHARRAPLFFRRLKLEWLYRTIANPRRIKRLLASHVPFVLKVKASARKGR